jgi:hypothetical protein
MSVTAYDPFGFGIHGELEKFVIGRIWAIVHGGGRFYKFAQSRQRDEKFFPSTGDEVSVEFFPPGHFKKFLPSIRGMDDSKIRTSRQKSLSAYRVRKNGRTNERVGIENDVRKLSRIHGSFGLRPTP